MVMRFRSWRSIHEGEDAPGEFVGLLEMGEMAGALDRLEARARNGGAGGLPGGVRRNEGRRAPNEQGRKPVGGPARLWLWDGPKGAPARGPGHCAVVGHSAAPRRRTH